MDKWEAYEVVEKHLCKEIDQLAEQIQKNGTMSVQDLEKLDKMFHLKKSMLTAKAMEEAEEYSGDYYPNQNGNSGYRGHGANGRYVSRMSGDNYTDGYNRGFSEAMNMRDGNSGHYPPAMPYGDRRW